MSYLSYLIILSFYPKTVSVAHGTLHLIDIKSVLDNLI